MPLNQWNTAKIEQLKIETGQALISDESTLVSFSQDFGKLVTSHPQAVFIPQSIPALQSVIRFAQQEKLPVTIRGNGLSQGGQSLAILGGITVSMQHFNKSLELNNDLIWVEANVSWASLLEKTLTYSKAPYVLPYNCNLCVGGVLSAGGIGSSSFKEGTVTAHVHALEVIDGEGELRIVDKNSDLFHACLSGQGRFAVITKACIQLKKVKKQVKTFCLLYDNQEQWWKDIGTIKNKVDYMELTCSPTIQAFELKKGMRQPKPLWLYAAHLSIEYDDEIPDLQDIGKVKPWKLMSTLDESIHSFLLRHNSRFDMMKRLGQWDLYHPWYECFIPTKVLENYLAEILQNLPLNFASLVHIVPIVKKKNGFLMFPKEDSVCEFMILNPGITEPLKENCLEAIKMLDHYFIPQGGKRYLSGFMGNNLADSYWKAHFEEHYTEWMALKKQYDPQGIFSSMLYPQ